VNATRTRLDRSAVIEVALGLADAEGVDAMTIRRLAKEVGVTPMALYWHFADKQALLDALTDQLWAEVQTALPSPPPDDPWDELRLLLGALVDVFRRHPTLAPLSPPRAAEGEPGLAVTERTLTLLDQLGYSADRAAEAARFALCSALMIVGAQPGIMIADAGEREATYRRKRAALLSLPPDRYPHVLASGESLVGCDLRPSYFDVGVEFVLGGIRALAD
jgi:AcrR family transcriptional regulator